VSNAAVDAAGSRIERFGPSPGRVFGLVMIGLAGAAIVAILLGDPGRDAKAIMFAAGLALVCYVVLVRPVVSANANGVLLVNMMRDVFIPWSAIDRCRSLHTLQIVTHDNTHFHGLGISRTSRQMARKNNGRTSLLSAGLSLGFASGSAARGSADGSSAGDRSGAGPRAASVVYPDYVENRIERLARESVSASHEPVVSWAWEAVAAMAAVLVLACLLFV
jgi:hypothetical protein